MNPQGYNTQYMNPSPPRRSVAVPIVLGILGLLLVAAVVGGIFAFKAGKTMTTAAGSVATAFIDDLEAHNWTAARGLVAPQELPQISVKDIKDLQQYVDNHYGKLDSMGTPGWFVNNNNGVTSVQLQYPATFAKGKATVQVVLTDTPAGYRVVGWHIN